MELREKIARLWWDTNYWPKTIGFRTDKTTFENSIGQVKDECYFYADQIIALFQSHYLELAKGKGLELTENEYMTAFKNAPDGDCSAHIISQALLVKVLAWHEAEKAEVAKAVKEERDRLLTHLECDSCFGGLYLRNGRWQKNIIIELPENDWQALKEGK